MNDEVTIDATLARALVNMAKDQPISSTSNLSGEEAEALIEFFRKPLPKWAIRKQ